MENPNTPTPSGMTPGAASAGSGRALRAVETQDLIAELYRRQSGRGDFTGDIEPCIVLAFTPSDLSEYWECDEAGSTNPASRVPEPEEWPAIVRAFARWQDCGNFSDLMQALRDAWQEEQARQLDSQEGKGESK